MKTPRIPYLAIIAVPLLLIFSGIASNEAVLVANWGKFPVMENAERITEQKLKNAMVADALGVSLPLSDPHSDMIDQTHSIMGHNSRLKFLADWIDLSDGIYSIGDMLLLLGAWLMNFAPAVWIALILKEFNN